MSRHRDLPGLPAQEHRFPGQYSLIWSSPAGCLIGRLANAQLPNSMRSIPTPTPAVELSKNRIKRHADMSIGQQSAFTPGAKVSMQGNRSRRAGHVQ
jgi:hypothetical protein